MPTHPDTHSPGYAGAIGTSPSLEENGLPPSQPAREQAELAQISDPDRFREDLLRLLPELKRLATAITQGGRQAEDLVQETLLRAWQNHDRYSPQSDLKVWILAIMRSSLYSQRRDLRCEVVETDVSAAEQ